jgi:PKHD-type hydroxylase
MNLTEHYWYFKAALCPKFCDEVIKYGNSKKEQMARTGQYDATKKLNDEEILDIKRKRDSDIVWLSEPWIYKEIQPYVHRANKNANWNFQWDWSEECQFTKYKLNQYYGWHSDSWSEPHKRTRKLSMTCQLSDSSDYQGGELEFDFRDYDPNLRDSKKHIIQCKEILPKGSIVVFPSFVWHRVKPVISGERYSLVVWNWGNPFV